VLRSWAVPDDRPFCSAASTHDGERGILASWRSGSLRFPKLFLVLVRAISSAPGSRAAIARPA